MLAFRAMGHVVNAFRNVQEWFSAIVTRRQTAPKTGNVRVAGHTPVTPVKEADIIAHAGGSRNE